MQKKFTHHVIIYDSYYELYVTFIYFHTEKNVYINRQLQIKNDSGSDFGTSVAYYIKDLQR